VGKWGSEGIRGEGVAPGPHEAMEGGFSIIEGAFKTSGVLQIRYTPRYFT